MQNLFQLNKSINIPIAGCLQNGFDRDKMA